MQQLERKLAEIDASDARNEETEYRLNSRGWDEDNSTVRQELMAILKIKMKEYDDLVFREHRMLRISKSSQKNHRRYFNFIWNEKPLCPQEYAFIFQEDDMLDLAAEQENEWLASMIDAIIAILPGKTLKVCKPPVVPGDRLNIDQFLFSTAADRDKDNSKYSVCYSTGRLAAVVKGLLLLISLILLVVPVALLYIFNTSAIGIKLGIIVAFITLFATALLFTTRARRHEIFVSAAT